MTRLVLAVIEAVAGTDAPERPVGFVAYAPRLWGPALWVRAAELTPGESWLAVAPSLLRRLRAIGEGYAATGAGPTPVPAGGPLPFVRIVLELGREHPLYDALPDRAVAGRRPPYAWYVRVQDLPAFLRRVAPVLETRLAASAAAGHTDELKLNFYRDGLILRFAAGRLTEAAPWPAPTREEAGASFPPLTFLHLLVGHRSLTDLEYAFADCGTRNEEARALLEALFPRASSLVWPVG